MIERLLKHGAVVNTTPEDIGPWGSALQAAAYNSRSSIPIKTLFNHGANVNARGGVLGNALAAAAYRNRKESVQWLIKHGADVNAKGGFYGTVLRTAMSKKTYSRRDEDKSLERMLLDAGAEYENTELLEGSVANSPPLLPKRSRDFSKKETCICIRVSSQHCRKEHTTSPLHGNGHQVA